MTSVMWAKTSSIAPVPFTDAYLPGCAGAILSDTTAVWLLATSRRRRDVSSDVSSARPESLLRSRDALDQFLFGDVDV